jgi:hypothetical protein
LPVKPSAEVVATIQQLLKLRAALGAQAWSGMTLIVSQDGRCKVDIDYDEDRAGNPRLH